MDFIEAIFGLSPDGGSGAFELLLFLIPVAGILAIRSWRKLRAPGLSPTSLPDEP